MHAACQLSRHPEYSSLLSTDNVVCIWLVLQPWASHSIYSHRCQHYLLHTLIVMRHDLDMSVCPHCRRHHLPPPPPLPLLSQIVISSDDPGILRTTLTREYVTLAFKFQYVKYDQIKTMAINGIKYSFIKDAALKARILKQVQDAFVAFEADFSRIAARVQRALMKETDTAAVKASLAAIRSLTA